MTYLVIFLLGIAVGAVGEYFVVKNGAVATGASIVAAIGAAVVWAKDWLMGLFG